MPLLFSSYHLLIIIIAFTIIIIIAARAIMPDIRWRAAACTCLRRSMVHLRDDEASQRHYEHAFVRAHAR